MAARKFILKTLILFIGYWIETIHLIKMLAFIRSSTNNIKNKASDRQWGCWGSSLIGAKKIVFFFLISANLRPTRSTGGSLGVPSIAVILIMQGLQWNCLNNKETY